MNDTPPKAKRRGIGLLGLLAIACLISLLLIPLSLWLTRQQAHGAELKARTAAAVAGPVIPAGEAASVGGRGDAGVSLGGARVAHLYAPTGQPEAVVVYLSGDGGWMDDPLPDSHARYLAQQGFLVIGLDSNALLAACPGPCAPLAQRVNADVQLIAAARPALLATAAAKPVLVGYSSGATLAYAGAAQDSAHHFAGVVTMGFCPDLDQGPPACAAGAFQPRADLIKGWVYPASPPSDPVILIQGLRDHGCPAAYVKPWANGLAGVTVWDAALATHRWRLEDGPDVLLPRAIRALAGGAGLAGASLAARLP